MLSLAFLIVLLAGIFAALERNHRRQVPSRMAGSVNFEDRDQARLRQQLDRLRARVSRPAREPWRASLRARFDNGVPIRPPNPRSGRQ